MSDNKNNNKAKIESPDWRTPHKTRGPFKSASETALSDTRDAPPEIEDLAGGAQLAAVSPRERTMENRASSDSGAMSPGNARGFPLLVVHAEDDGAMAGCVEDRERNVETTADVQAANMNSDQETVGEVPTRTLTVRQDLRMNNNNESNVLPQNFDAQEHYPREWAIFVANLPMDKSNVELQRMVLFVFKDFGMCFVHIRRSREMPYAFVQYTNPADALRALECGAGLSIGGRPCRIEQCLGDTFFLVRRRLQGLGSPLVASPEVTLTEVRELMGSLGEIAEAVYADRYHTAVRVTYRYRNNQRQPVRVFENDPNWEVSRENITAATMTGPELPANDWQVLYQRYTRSAWFGKMPHTFDADILRNLCRKVGQVYSIDFRPARALMDGSPSTAFAFVEFAIPTQVDAAIAAFHGRIFDGRRLKVERRRPPPESPRRNETSFGHRQAPSRHGGNAGRSAGVFSPPMQSPEAGPANVHRGTLHPATPVRTNSGSQGGSMGHTHGRGTNHQYMRRTREDFNWRDDGVSVNPIDRARQDKIQETRSPPDHQRHPQPQQPQRPAAAQPPPPLRRPTLDQTGPGFNANYMYSVAPHFPQYTNVHPLGYMPHMTPVM